MISRLINPCFQYACSLTLVLIDFLLHYYYYYSKQNRPQTIEDFASSHDSSMSSSSSSQGQPKAALSHLDINSDDEEACSILIALATGHTHDRKVDTKRKDKATMTSMSIKNVVVNLPARPMPPVHEKDKLHPPEKRAAPAGKSVPKRRTSALHVRISYFTHFHRLSLQPCSSPAASSFLSSASSSLTSKKIPENDKRVMRSARRKRR
ncbi:hypothetical protein BDF20DRAFT_839996 [Mycotypha africana]|uniref:uncharacterized protein n=1 Tax=Mycotypha africana TaxID=64632 RepID=UPI002300D0DA|nr:uncharacterized protein BDF20DRAFT_839996 [Mycotypha africana]KAI8967787.1 hypothetical protein BDF20DRAFT_839996 [Mycotypha africana]